MLCHSFELPFWKEESCRQSKRVGGGRWPGGSCGTTMRDMLGGNVGLGLGKKGSELNA